MAVPATVDAQFERMRGDRFAIGHRRARQGVAWAHSTRNTPLRSSSENATVPMPCQPRSRATLAATARSALHRRRQVRRRTFGDQHARLAPDAALPGTAPSGVAARRHHDMDVQPALASGRGSGVVRGRSAPVPGAARRYDCGNFCSHRPLPVFLLAWQAYHLRMTGIGDGARGAVRRRCRSEGKRTDSNTLASISRPRLL